MATPETHYELTSDGVYIAYQILGEGPIDVVWQPDWPGNLDVEWEFPALRALLETLASFSRLIRHDFRGIGLSSRNVPIPNLETRVSDLLRVLDAVGAERPVLVGVTASGAVNALLAATRPERVSALAWFDPTPRTIRAPDYPWGRTPEEVDAELRTLELWGTDAYVDAFVEDQASMGVPFTEAEAEAFAKASRNACTPDVAIELAKIWGDTDVREILPMIRVPTLFLAHESQDQGQVRDAADRVPGAELRVVSGEPFAVTTFEAVGEEIRRFAGVARAPVDLDTTLSTVLFTDIVGSTQALAELGDRRWKELVEAHHRAVRGALARWHGVEADTAGDGFYATFDGPARGIRCALEICERVQDLGIEVRAGLHTGECRMIDGKMGGVAVSIGARVAASAPPSEVRVSQTVKDLVAGSGFTFEDAGEHELKGVPDRWHLYRVVRG